MNQIRDLMMVTTKKIGLTVILLCLFAALFTFFVVLRNNKLIYKERILPTRHALDVSRANIAEYHKRAGVYPNNLNDVSQIENNQHKKDFDALPLHEFISKKEGNNFVHDLINDKGGWYYNSKTGEIRVNLNNPVNKYFKFYRGIHSEQIPSEW